MARYILGRLAGLAFVMLVVSFITFFMMYSAPGGPWNEMNQPLSDNARANMKHKYGLDQPFYVNWWQWLGKAVRGDFGESYVVPNTKVLDLYLRFWGSSLMLGGLAVLWSFPVGILFGVVAALKRNTIVDQVLTTLSLMTVTLPQISLIFIGITVFVIELKWFGFTSGRPLYEQPVQAWILPVFLFGVGPVGQITRYTRSGMLDVLGQDYIRTAKAKGVSRTSVILKHAMRNMLVPLVTVFGPTLANAITGSTYIEVAFAIPGIGKYFLSSIFSRDYPLIIFTVILTATILTVSNLVIDLTYTLIDPRVRVASR